MMKLPDHGIPFDSTETKHVMEINTRWYPQEDRKEKQHDLISLKKILS